MIKIKKGIVTKNIKVTNNIQIVEVKLNNRTSYAINFLDINNPVDINQEVLVNITANYLNLGTGGYDFIIPQGQFENKKNGHIMKLRYTPLQFSVLTEEEKDKTIFERTPYLNKENIVVCELHSMIAPIAIYLKQFLPKIKISVILTDWGMLNANLSENIQYLKSKKLIDFVITCGEAFNGDFECINEINSIILSQQLQADVIIIGPLPGIVGTGSKFGFSTYNMIHVIEDIYRFNGQAILPIRLSKMDKRDRHKIISHHFITILNYLNAQAIIPLYKFEDNVFYDNILKIIEKYKVKHRIIYIDSLYKLDLNQHLAILNTMKKGINDEKEFFDECFATAHFILQKIKGDVNFEP
ncbi:DUF3866 family protein [Caldicellulosiruptoraceae bacterium PP1]